MPLPEDRAEPRCLTRISTSVPSTSSGSVGPCRSRSQYGAVLEELPVARQVPLGWRDVGVGLDHVSAQRLVALGHPAMGGGAGQDHVVTLADRQRTEHRLDGRGPGLDVDALVADRIAVERAGLAGSDVGDADVAVAEHEAPAGDEVGALPLLAREQVVQPQVPGQQRPVLGQRLVGRLPWRRIHHRRRDGAVVEQRGVRGESFLSHQLLGVQPALRRAVLGVPLGWDRPDAAVVRHAARLLGCRTGTDLVDDGGTGGGQAASERRRAARSCAACSVVIP